jgi:hypothetical protein
MFKRSIRKLLYKSRVTLLVFAFGDVRVARAASLTVTDLDDRSPSSS